MSNNGLLAEYELTGGLMLRVLNATRHYYGGYYHVKLVAMADVVIDAEMFDSHSFFLQAVDSLGISLRFERTLEKMAVPEREVESARQNLLASFADNVLPYLSRKDFPTRFVLSEYEKHLKSGITARRNII